MAPAAESASFDVVLEVGNGTNATSPDDCTRQASRWTNGQSYIIGQK